MKAYHKKIFFDPKDLATLEAVIDGLNSLEWILTAHAKERLENKPCKAQIMDVLENDGLAWKNLFEYKKEGERIARLAFRLPLNNQSDLCLVLTPEGIVVTFWLNSKNDGHETLKRELYAKN